MSIEIEDIEAIVSAVWESILDRPLGKAGAPAEYRRAGNIDIIGRWSGSVMLEVDLSSLRRAAAAMFDVEPASVSEAKMNDALAELTNMVGGNVKCLLDEPTRLSLPAVQTVDLDDPDIGEIDRQVTLTDGQGTVRVKLIRVA